ncbi:MAG: MFS transporter [Methanobacteriaceae archaeon]|nr:MFS transporter [Methanobacteriaceae archaeon]
MTDYLNKHLILIITSISSFLTPFTGSALNIALPSISNELANNAILLSWLPLSFYLVTAVSTIPLGRIADIYGIRKIFTYGVIIFTLSSFLAGLCMSMEILIVFRALQGMGSAMMLVTGLAMLVVIFKTGEKGKAIGINSAAVFMGMSSGPLIGGFLTQFIGWRSIFFTTAILGLIAILFFQKTGDNKFNVKSAGKFDIKGSLVFSLTLLILLIGFSNIYTDPGKIMVLTGLIGILSYVFLELEGKINVLNLNILLKSKNFIMGNIAIFISVIGSVAVAFLLNLYLQYIKGLDPGSVGIILTIQPLCMILISPLAGELSDRFKGEIIGLIGLTISNISLFSLAFINSYTNLNLILFYLALLGIGLGLFSAPNTHAILGNVKPKFYGVTSAMVSTMRMTGQTFSMSLIILIFSKYLGYGQIIPENYPSLLSSIQIIFFIIAIISLGAVFALGILCWKYS